MQVSGIQFLFDPSKPAGSRVFPGSVKVSGLPMDLQRRYKGGDYFLLFERSAIYAIPTAIFICSACM